MAEENRRVPQDRASKAVARGQKLKIDKGTFLKLIKRTILPHKFAWLVVCILILVSAICDVQSSLFIGKACFLKY